MDRGFQPSMMDSIELHSVSITKEALNKRSSSRTVSFSEMGHPDMSGEKQRTIRRQGRYHH